MDAEKQALLGFGCDVASPFTLDAIRQFNIYYVAGDHGYQPHPAIDPRTVEAKLSSAFAVIADQHAQHAAADRDREQQKRLDAIQRRTQQQQGP